MNEMSKQLDKDLSKIFFNSVEEMNERYGVDAEMPSELYSNADLVCYEIVEPFAYKYLAQHVFAKDGFHHLNGLGELSSHNRSKIKSESAIIVDDLYRLGGRCFVYVRVNEYLRKYLEKSLLGCEFVHCSNKEETSYRRFIHSVEVRELSFIVVRDQDGLLGYLSEQMFYPDDHSDPIPYQEWVKQINKQDVELED